MRADELKKLLDHRPFRPLRLLISSGEPVDLRHPEMARVTRSLVTVALPPTRGVADYVVHYSLIHGVKVVPLNGARRRKGRRKRTA